MFFWQNMSVWLESQVAIFSTENRSIEFLAAIQTRRRITKTRFDSAVDNPRATRGNYRNYHFPMLPPPLLIPLLLLPPQGKKFQRCILWILRQSDHVVPRNDRQNLPTQQVIVRSLSVSFVCCLSQLSLARFFLTFLNFDNTNSQDISYVRLTIILYLYISSFLAGHVPFSSCDTSARQASPCCWLQPRPLATQPWNNTLCHTKRA